MGRFALSRFLSLGVVLILICGCSYPISKAIRSEATEDLTFSMVLADPAMYRGAVVIWGGIVMRTINHPHSTELVVLETPLGYWETPKGRKYTRGRFIARTSKFLEPEIYKKGTRITVAGEIEGQELKTAKGVPYAYPVIKIIEIHWWKKKPWYPQTYYYGYDWGWGSPYYTPGGYIQELEAP
ncbi:MAG: Slp family lipoprotein [Candidatus Sulfobium sp.]|jgi:outer membrane lipoprotein